MRLDYISRALESKILSASDQFPVLILTGPRQTGKTTLLLRLKDEARGYVSLDSLSERILAHEDPELFLQRHPAPLIIDELQYAPELLPIIKIRSDAERKPGSYWLTGSQQFSLMKRVTESLAGRAAIITLNGLSEREARRTRSHGSPFIPRSVQQPGDFPSLDEPALFHRIFSGSYPALVSGAVNDTALFYGSYVQTYLERDLRELSQVGDLASFYVFLKVLAGRTGTILNLSEISRDCAISVPTVKRWISILEAGSLIYLLRPYASNRGSRLIKSPKLYFIDTGLCSHLAGYSSPETLAAGPLRGAIFETWCLSEILKSWWYDLKEPPLFYYRDRDGAEIDLVIETDGTLFPVEMKLGASPRKDWVRHFAALRRLSPRVGPGAVLCLTDKAFPIDRETVALPASSI